MKKGSKVSTPDGNGIIVDIEAFRLSTRYGVTLESTGKTLYYWINELILTQ